MCLKILTKNILLSHGLYINNMNDFFQSIWSKGEVGLGESFSRGSWNCPTLLEFFKILIKNQEKLKSFRQKILYFHKSGIEDKQSIYHHYDVGTIFMICSLWIHFILILVQYGIIHQKKNHYP